MDLYTPEQDTFELLTLDSFRQPEYLADSAWLEHAPFLSWLIAAQRPACFVELGCHHGYSYFTACQTVKSLGLHTACFAVDTWEGDEQAGFYGPDVFAAVQAHNAAHYPSFSQLIRARFNDAVGLFSDRSVELLHIDGRHHYEDVAEDLAAWRPKLAPDGIVLLHDTNVRRHDFGVHQLFREIRSQHPTFEFLHGHGLGVIALGRIPSRLKLLFDSGEKARSLLHVAYSTLGRSIADKWQIGRLERREHDRAQESARIIAELEKKLAQHGEALERQANEHRSALQRAIADGEGKAAEAADAASELRKELAARNDAFRSIDSLREAQVAAIGRLRDTNKKLRQELAEATADIERLHHERTLLLTSSTWRLTEPLRSFLSEHPRAKRASVTVIRTCWWLVTFQWSRIASAFRRRSQLRRDEQALTADPMFDAEYYRRRHYPVSVNGWSPERHYLLIGRHRMQSPHPLFDVEWYRDNNPEVTRAGADPLLHYIRVGRRARRSPNQYFDPAWYMRRYPDVAAAGIDPVEHFLMAGAAEGRDPSSAFKTRWYLDQYRDVAALGINPLAHFLDQGRKEGRVANAYEVDSASAGSVIDTPIECRKQPEPRREVAIFVTHSPDGKLKPHVRFYLENLVRNDIAVTLVVASDCGFHDDESWLMELVDGLYVRANQGWDFACWVHVLRLNRPLLSAEIVYWLNDSVIGPTSEGALKSVLERVRASPAALVGLTANHERGGRHIQSYFLAIKTRALQSLAFHEFIQNVRCLDDKDDVINAYEIRFSRQLEAWNLPTEALYEPNPVSNPTVYNWKELLRQGFPFLKVSTVKEDFPGVETKDWREELQRHGYDVRLADGLLLEREDPACENAGPIHRRSCSADSQEIAFFGPWNFGNGLGVASRGYVSALLNSGLPANILPVERPFHVHQRVAPSLGMTELVAPPGIAIVHLNPESWGALLTPEQNDLIESARFRVGAFVWESQKLPQTFTDALHSLDAIWAPSSYCAKAFSAVAECPVHIVHYPVPLAHASAGSSRRKRMKEELGFGEDDRIILYSFDATSYLSRKNPGALVRAFQASELAARGWRLVLKTKHLSHASVESRDLRTSIEDTEGVMILDRSMSSETARVLMDTADIYASPHASEGFGLTVAEAMGHGKIVIASDFGGTTDFLDSSCGFPVGCEPWELEHDEGPYRRGTVWARVNEQLLAQALLRAADLSDEERVELGGNARQRIRERLSPAAVASEMRSSINVLLGMSES